MQRFELILEPVVQTGPLFNLLSGKEAVRPHAVIEENHDNVIPGRLHQTRSIEPRAGVFGEAPTLDPEKDGEFLVGVDRVRRSKDIHEQAVLGGLRGHIRVSAGAHGNADIAMLVDQLAFLMLRSGPVQTHLRRRLNFSRVDGVLGCRKAQVADRRSGIAHS